METVMKTRRSRKDQEARTTRLLALAMVVAILVVLATALALPALAKSGSKGRLTTGHEDLESQMKTQAVVTMLVLRLGESR